MRFLKSIIIHCSDTPNGRHVGAVDIDTWHKEFKFNRDPALIGYNQPSLLHIGYHFVINVRGAVTIGRGLNEIGAHCLGQNRNSIGVCMIGRNQYSPDQWATLARLVKGLTDQYKTINGIHGHREFNEHKTCPGFDVQQWLQNDMSPSLENVFNA